MAIRDREGEMSIASAVTRKISEFKLAREFAARGPWCTRFDIGDRSYGGELDYRGDKRVKYALSEFPDARTILELGSLEGGQSFQLARTPGMKVLAIEGRADNLHRAQWVQKILGVDNITFVQGNLETIELEQYGPVDLVFCSGLLYHLPRPWELIEQIASITGNLFLSTHYVEDAKATEEVNGYRGDYYSEQTDPLSGMSARSFLLTLDSLQQALRDNGFSAIEILETFHPPSRGIKIGSGGRSIGGRPQVHMAARK
jgi:SAM-dependent methyltransferase